MSNPRHVRVFSGTLADHCRVLGKLIAHELAVVRRQIRDLPPDAPEAEREALWGEHDFIRGLICAHIEDCGEIETARGTWTLGPDGRERFVSARAGKPLGEEARN